MASTSKINANGIEIGIIEDKTLGSYLCLTDIARYKNDEDPNGVIANWLRNRSTIEFLGLWEEFNNNDFKPIEFEGFKNRAGENAFTLSPQNWIKETNAIGL